MTSLQSKSPEKMPLVPLGATADICDANPDARVALSWFRSFGKVEQCAGPIEIISTRDDNSLVKAALREPGAARVLLIDNLASCNCAMLGGNLARLAADNGWAGIIVNGAVRDSAELKEIPLAVFALATCPRKSVNRGVGQRGCPVRVGSERITPKDYLAADKDGVVILSRPPALGETL